MTDTSVNVVQVLPGKAASIRSAAIRILWQVIEAWRESREMEAARTVQRCRDLLDGTSRPNRKS